MGRGVQRIGDEHETGPRGRRGVIYVYMTEGILGRYATHLNLEEILWGAIDLLEGLLA